jgi:outer membrane protein assembly factor BamA
MGCSGALAQSESKQAARSGEEDALTKLEKSPWLITPLFSSNPKLGTAIGAMGGYIHYFDEKSRPSIFGVTGQYTSTGSVIAGIFARTSFDQDHQRLIVGSPNGKIKNDYDDYLGTGVPLKNEAEMHAFIARYTYRIYGDAFIGVQGIYQNFAIAGESGFDDQVLDVLGVKPFKAAGLGLVFQYDSRDNEFMPSKGWLINANNLAYRESLGGENDYDFYRLEFRYFLEHGNRNVIALRQLNNFTHDAPAAARATVQLRGYKFGQFSAENMSSIEVEERYRFAEKWTATLFAGVACLYGSGQNCSDSANVFPAYGAGVQYILKPKEGIVANLEYAAGKDKNYGVILKMGYAY